MSAQQRKHASMSLGPDRDDGEIKYLDVGPKAQLPPPYAEDISALVTMVLS